MKYIVTERQVVEYTWVVDSAETKSLDDALQAIDGVPECAKSKLIDSETHAAPACAEGDHPNDDNPGRPICRTCDDDPNVSSLYFKGDYGTCQSHADIHVFTDDCIGWRDFQPNN